MLYNMKNSDGIDIQEISNTLLRIAYKGDLTMKTLAIEGLCKLLVCDKLVDET